MTMHWISSRNDVWLMSRPRFARRQLSLIPAFFMPFLSIWIRSVGSAATIYHPRREQIEGGGAGGELVLRLDYNVTQRTFLFSCKNKKIIIKRVEKKRLEELSSRTSPTGFTHPSIYPSIRRLRLTFTRAHGGAGSSA